MLCFSKYLEMTSCSSQDPYENYYPDTVSLYIDLSSKTGADRREISPGMVLNYDKAETENDISNRSRFKTQP
jgi:hypothetical protein